MPRMNEGKKATINLKVSPETHAQFSLACDLREATMSKVLHAHILRIINEEKEKHPQKFENFARDEVSPNVSAPAPVKQRIAS